MVNLENTVAKIFESMLLTSGAKDYIDLFTIIKSHEIHLSNIRKIHSRKYKLLKVSDMSLATTYLKVNEILEYPTMKIDFDRKKLIEFFEGEAKRLSPKIFR